MGVGAWVGFGSGRVDFFECVFLLLFIGPTPEI